MKHLLKLLDLSGEEIIEILNLADQLKYETKHGIEHPYLKGKALGMIFEKSSTRCSCPTAICRSAAASRCRTPRACSPAMWTAS